MQISFSWQLAGSHSQMASILSAQNVTVPTGATAVILTARTKNVNYTLDGTAPTSVLGNILEADKESVLVPVQAGQTLKFIQASATGTVDFQFVVM